MKTLFSSILATFIFSLSYAQLEQSPSESDLGQPYNFITIKNSSNKDITGSPYLNETFLPGEIYTKDGKLHKGIKLRYNIYKDEIEFMKGEEILGLKRREITIYAVIGSDTLLTKVYGDSDNVGYGHFFLLVSGKKQLLVKKRKNFLEGTEEKGYVEAKNPAFVDAGENFYLSNNDDMMANEVPKKKEISAFFGDKETEITTYMKQEKISLRKQSDLVKLVSYYNSIQ